LGIPYNIPETKNENQYNRKKPIIKLYNHKHNKLATLYEAYNINVSEKFGQLNELEFILPRYEVDSYNQIMLDENDEPFLNPKWEFIQNEVIVEFDDKFYLIKNPIDKLTEDNKLISNVQCKEMAIELSSKYVQFLDAKPPVDTPKTISEIITLVLSVSNSGWVLGEIDSSLLADSRTFTFEWKTALECLYDIIQKYNGDVIIGGTTESLNGYLDFDISWDSINNKWVKKVNVLMPNSYFGLQFKYNKNIKSIERQSDSNYLSTRIYPFGKDNLSINNIATELSPISNASDPSYPSYESHTLGQSYIDNFEYFLSQGYTYQECLDNFIYEHRFVSDSYVNEADLYNDAKQILNKSCYPKLNYNLNIVDLSVLTEYSYERFVVGDTVRIIDEDLGIDVNGIVLNVNRNYDNPHLTSVEVTNFTENVSNKIREAVVQAEQVYKGSAYRSIDNRKRVFRAQPIAPYSGGDLWIVHQTYYESDGTTVKYKQGDLLVCNRTTERQYSYTGNNFDINDWIVATRYTDDTIANQAKTDAEKALQDLSEISSDQKLTPVEKLIVKKEYDVIVAEKVIIENQSNSYSVSNTNYITAYNDLVTYISPILTDLTIPTEIDRTVFNNKFKTYYDAKVDILNAITNKAKLDAIGEITSTGSTVVIGIENVSRNYKYADYIIPQGSTTAQDIINAAISDISTLGGKIVLLEGTYSVSNSINLNSNITIQGQGTNTVVVSNTENGIDFNIFQNLSPVNFVVIKDLMIKGRTTTPLNIGVSFVDSNSILLDNLHVERCYKNIKFDISDTFKIIKCKSIYSGDGIYIENCNNVIIDQNILNYNTNRSGSGIYLKGNNDYINITNNSIKNNVWDGIRLFGEEASLDTYKDLTIMNNNTSNNSKNGISMYKVSDCNISNNICKNNKYNGISIGDSKRCLISSNIVMYNSQYSDSYSANILLYAGASGNTILSNICKAGDLTNKPSYGIDIRDINCDSNIVTNNDLYLSGTLGSLNDNGTGTITSSGNRL